VECDDTLPFDRGEFIAKRLPLRSNLDELCADFGEIFAARGDCLNQLAPAGWRPKGVQR
jgi:hypothetical protein